jgi:hypothetical protein
MPLQSFLQSPTIASLAGKSAGVLRSSEQEEMARLLQELEVFPKMNQRSCWPRNWKRTRVDRASRSCVAAAVSSFRDSAHSLQLSQRLRAGLN